jgi:hypothetical protein
MLCQMINIIDQTDYTFVIQNDTEMQQTFIYQKWCPIIIKHLGKIKDFCIWPKSKNKFSFGMLFDLTAEQKSTFAIN